jgi:hypothetical protein
MFHKQVEEAQAFFALVGFGPKENISAALRMKSPLPLLKFTYVTDAILLSFLCVGVGGGDL